MHIGLAFLACLEPRLSGSDCSILMANKPAYRGQEKRTAEH